MKTTLLRAGALSCALLASTALTAPAAAQTAPPAHRNLDANGVDLTVGDFVMSFVEGSIGSGPAELSLVRTGIRSGISNGTRWDGLELYETSSLISVSFGTRVETFNGTGSSNQGNGSTLSQTGSTYVHTAADGTTTTFSQVLASCNPATTACHWVPTAIQSPDGRTTNLNWEPWLICSDEVPDPELCVVNAVRLTRIFNSYGYEVDFNYASGGSGGQGGATSSWHERTSADFYNSAISYTPQASVSYAYPSSGVTQVTDRGGRVWRFTGTVTGVTGIRRPGAGSDTTTISYSSGQVTSVTREGVTTGYSRSVSGSTATMNVTDAASQVTTVVSDMTIGRPTSVTDPLSRTTSFSYDGSARLTRVTAPEGNYVNYTYDGRGNVTETRAVAKSGSGLSDIVATASYDSSCSNPVTCNQPNSTTDARGFRTDYSYDSTHGGLQTVTAPAPTGGTPVGGGVRPETRYSYTLTNGEYVLTGISACATGSTASPTCVGTADESRTVLAYDANGNTTSVTRQDGTGTLTATSAMTYDALGNRLTVDGPLSGSADTTRYRYNAARQVVGAIGPDPDGGGTLKHRAVRATYTNGLATSVEQGNVDSQSDGDWAAFSASQRVEQDYDAYARPITQRLMSGISTYQVSQTSYDSLGRVHCTVQRMNPAEFASLTSNACALDTQGTGANDFGPDRITRTTYDNAGQVTKIETGYGVTGEAADEASFTYTANGRVERVFDANGNNDYTHYDGFDRPDFRVMPHPTILGGWNWSDYELFAYDAAGNLTSTQLRDGSTLAFSYDNLGRLKTKNLPGSELDVTYDYDLLGRMTSAATSAQTLTFGFDALGRNTSQTGPFGTVGYGFDVAGRRTSMTYPDSGLIVGYGYNVAGDLTEIRENPSGGNVLLATYAWDNLGRRVSLTRGNGTVTSYGYDAVSRLNQLVQNLNGTGSDLTLDFTHNPAGEIATNTRSNDGYSYTGHANANVTGTPNGLNQLTAVGGTSNSHDARGNVSAIGGASYAYSSENMLASVSGVASLAYDPLNRLVQTSGATTTRFGYDGGQMIGEYNSSNALQRRFVFGPGMDEPLVWYEGSATSTRRWFHADERGSVAAVSDAAGDVVTAVNRYDEYGNVQGTLTGRFGYTGQAWLPEIGLYHYRARAYNPALGRFMQTDPIGYGGGMNLYAYVGNNPVNFTDPMGLADQEVIVTGNPRNRPQNGGVRIPGAPTLGYQEADYTQRQRDRLPDCNPAIEDDCALVIGQRPSQSPPVSLLPTSLRFISFSRPSYCEGDTGPIYCRNVGREIGEAIEEYTNEVRRCIRRHFWPVLIATAGSAIGGFRRGGLVTAARAGATAFAVALLKATQQGCD